MLLTREYLARAGGWSVLKEATSIQQADRVASVAYDGETLSGTIRLATGLLSPRLKVSPRLSEVEALCSCRQAREQGIVCAHVLALGLEWIALKDGTKKAAVPAKAATSAPVPAPAAKAAPSRLVAWSESDAPAPFTVSFLLPLDLPAAWRAGKMRIILEAGSGGETKPWDAVLKSHTGPLPVLDEAADALRLLERRAGAGGLPGMVLLDDADRDAFLLSLAGYPHVSLGKKGTVSIARAAAKPKVQVTRLPDGNMRIELLADDEVQGEWFPSTGGRWRFTGTALEFHPLRGAILQRLAAQPLLLAPDQVPHFLQLPSVAEQVEIILCPESEAIEWREAKPLFRASLDGSLATLTCRLEAVYGKKAIPLSTATFAAPNGDNPARWIPAEPNLYLGRDGKAEARARGELDEAGFAAMPRQADLRGLEGEAGVIAFLANRLPDWRRMRWQVVLTPRLHALLGQCEVIEPRVSLARGGGDWLSLKTSFQSTNGQAVLGAGEVQQLLQTGRSHKRLASGKIALIPVQAIAEWQEVLADCDPAAGLGGSRIDPRYAPYLEEALRAGGIAGSDGEKWKAPERITKGTVLALPADLEPILRPYQKEGVAWLHSLAEGGFCGILADEMGLGKTLQVLAYLAARRAAQRPKMPALVVAPTSLLVNWQREAARFTPQLKTAILHGTDRHGLWERLHEYDLVVTSYALIRRDLEHYRGLEFDLVALDEAQHIKNRFSGNAQAVKELRARDRIILTGTPLENSLLDLWSMFDFLMPGYLGPARSFRDRYEAPISKESGGPAMKRLRRRVHPFLLRRTKAAVAQEIPAKLESVTYCDLTDEQREVYRAVLEQGRREVFEHSGKQGNAGKRTMAMLTTLTRLRQACCHLDLLPLERATPWKEPSAKVDSLFELIEEASDGGHRLLVFSQFVKLLKLIALRLAGEGIPFCYLDGATNDRQKEIDRFQNTPGIPVFLISLKAGGTGLNLTAADTVIHCDPWWNPAVEEQATARAHRMGQTRIVTSYKLIARDTVEEKILQLQQKKKDLIAQTLLGEKALLAQLTQEEWEGLLAP